MAFTYARTHSKGEEEFYKAGQLFQDLSYSLDRIAFLVVLNMAQ